MAPGIQLPILNDSARCETLFTSIALAVHNATNRRSRSLRNKHTHMNPSQLATVMVNSATSMVF